MNPSSKGLRRIGVAAALCACVWSATAIEPYQEYRKHIESAQNLTALKDDLFGESVSLYNGQTEFAVTDVSLTGNNALPVQVRRRFSVELDLVGSTSYNANIDGVGGWEVDVPSVSGMFPANGWADNRCTGHIVPSHNVAFQLTDLWQGNTIHIPGEGDRKMLGADANSSLPEDGKTRKWTSPSRDAIDCIPMKSGLSGEGYRVTTTEGVTYYFDVAASRSAGIMRKSLGPISATAARVRIYLFASRVEDRFGNWVQYDYNGNGHPTRIVASDGREIILTYNGANLSKVDAVGRSWSYSYGAVQGMTRLSGVALPDGSRWGYSYSNALRVEEAIWDGNSTSNCAEVPPETIASMTMNISHPSGAQGEFQFANRRHYRSGVHASECMQRSRGGGGSSNIPESSIYYVLGRPNYFDVVALGKKTITGPGLAAPLEWEYRYGGVAGGLWGGPASPALYPCTFCQTEKRVQVVNPDKTSTIYQYGVQYALNEGRLLGSSVLDADGKTISVKTTTYMTTAEATGKPFPFRHGLIFGPDDPSIAQIRPVVAESVDQDGDSYQTSMLEFDALARPVRVNRMGPVGSRTDRTTYYDDKVRWVLSQSASQTNLDTGLIEAQTAYDNLARPTQVWAFGKLMQTLTYNADGTVATVADGNGKVTTLSQWKRGIPQYIRHPDGAVQTASVYDSGLINKVTDENGATTVYEYDQMFRLASIAWPTGDTVAWAPTSQVFAQINATEYGLAPGHWRQIVETGNGRKLTYFDAFWRPVLTREYDGKVGSATLRTQRFAYNEAGQQSFASYPGSTETIAVGTWTEYDALGRVRSTSADSELGVITSLTEYLPGSQKRITDGRGNATTIGFQAYGAPSEDNPLWIRHPEGAFTDIARDVFGKPLSITRRNGDGTQKVTRSYVYDANQQLCKSVEPEIGATAMGYDAAGNLAWSASGLTLTSTTSCDAVTAKASARRVDRTYDARNRLATLRFPDRNGDQDWVYTKDGKPAVITTLNEGGKSQITNTYGYNKRGLLVAETASTAAASQSLAYGYDTQGNLSALTYPSGLTIDYAPNGLGQPTKAGTYATAVTYHPTGGMKQFTYGNGIVHTMTLNARRTPSRVKDSAGVLDNTYAYDRNGNVSRITDHNDATRNRELGYDALDRLIKAQSPAFGGDGIFRYTYDALDNLRSAKLVGIKDHTYWYDAKNRLANVQNSAGATTVGLTYDVQGNLSRYNASAYTFDFGNRMRSAGGKEVYQYDAHGRRIVAWAQDDRGTIRSLYGQDGVLRRQDNVRDGKIYEYVHLNGSLVAKVSTVFTPAVPALSGPASSSTGTIKLDWTSVSNATRYELRERRDAGAWSTPYSGTARTWTGTGRVEGVYNYMVRACQASGCSGWSSKLSVVVKSVPTGTATVSVPNPAIAGNYTVTWTTVAGASSYRLHEKVGSGDWKTVQDGTETSYAVTGKASNTYSYRVVACNEGGCGVASAVATTKTLYKPTATPTMSGPAQAYGGSFTVSWTAVSGATRYSLEENRENAGWKVIATVAGTSQALSGKTTGAYRYRVRSANDAGFGPYATAITIPVLLVPNAPKISVPTDGTGGRYTISWSAVAHAASYALEESYAGGAFWVAHETETTSSARAAGRTGNYVYRVKACNAAGCSGYSAAAGIDVTVIPETPSIRSSVQTVWKIGKSTKQRCAVSWTAVEGAETYELKAYTGSTQYTGPATSVSSEYGAYCAYRQIVRACNTAGCSLWSDPPYPQYVDDLGDLTIPR